MKDNYDMKDLTNSLDEYNNTRLFETNKSLNKFVYNNFVMLKKLRVERGESWDNLFNFFKVYFAGNDEIMNQLNEIKTARKLAGLYVSCENYFNKNKNTKQKKSKKVGGQNESHWTWKQTKWIKWKLWVV